MTPDGVTEAYNARAERYIETVGQVERWPADDRELLLDWVRSVDGLLLDVGCGPGQWTDLFRAAGIDVVGVDPASAFIEDARRRFPLTRFRVGRAEELGEPDASVGGVLAWFSLIHLPPEAIDVALAEIARVLAPGGSLLIGFFLGEAGQPFAHPITTAYTWTIEALTARLEQAGITVQRSRVRGDPVPGAQALIVAARPTA